MGDAIVVKKSRARSRPRARRAQQHPEYDGDGESNPSARRSASSCLVPTDQSGLAIHFWGSDSSSGGVAIGMLQSGRRSRYLETAIASSMTATSRPRPH
ncbi:hypothetical protein VTO73DRAFT_9152 [Trametes versicolor]